MDNDQTDDVPEWRCKLRINNNNLRRGDGVGRKTVRGQREEFKDHGIIGLREAFGQIVAITSHQLELSFAYATKIGDRRILGIGTQLIGNSALAQPDTDIAKGSTPQGAAAIDKLEHGGHRIARHRRISSLYDLRDGFEGELGFFCSAAFGTGMDH